MRQRVSDTAEIRLQLHLLLSSRTFSRAVGQRHLLKYIADKTMDRALGELNQKAIADQVFKNPDKWAIVGTTANRIRKSMARYYATEGRADAIVFYLPLGSYSLWWEPRTGSMIAPPPPSTTVDHSVPAEEFAEFLQSVCDLEGISIGERNRRVQHWVESSARFRGVTLDPRREFEAFFESIREREPLRFSEMRSLTKDLGIHPLMLDRLRATPVLGDCMVLHMPPEAPANTLETERPECIQSNFVATPAQVGEHGYGFRTHYYSPDRRIAGTDVSFVYLILEPSGYSDDHHHPGDELLLVLRGSMRVQFADSGLQFDLGRGSFVHFTAEQVHSAHNLSGEAAHALIIRFNQLLAADTRRKLGEEISLALTREDTVGPVPLRSGTWGWIIEVAAEYSRKGTRPATRSVSPEEVQNHLGLARLLARLPAPRRGKIERFLDRTREETGRKYETLAQWLWHVQTNQVRIPTDLIPAIATLYDVFDLLICDFLFPSVPCQALVRRNIEPRVRDGIRIVEYQDWALVADAIRGLESIRPSDGVDYEIPRRNLSCSDVAIAWLTLQPDRMTRPNHHPGCELLLPLEGEVTVEYTDNNLPISRLTTRQFAYYRSDREHRIVNQDKQNQAQLFLIRFYGESCDRRATSPPGEEARPRTVGGKIPKVRHSSS